MRKSPKDLAMVGETEIDFQCSHLVNKWNAAKRDAEKKEGSDVSTEGNTKGRGKLPSTC
jgi:hypothetical protein